MPSLYLETTIVSYLTARPARDIVIAGKQEVTREWWASRRKDFSLFVSPYVLRESMRGNRKFADRRMDLLKDFPVLKVDEEVLEIARALLASKHIPIKAETDAYHISIATRHNIDYLLTWNCTHLANAEIGRSVYRVVTGMGYPMPVICTPDELLGVD